MLDHLIPNRAWRANPRPVVKGFQASPIKTLPPETNRPVRGPLSLSHFLICYPGSAIQNDARSESQMTRTAPTLLQILQRFLLSKGQANPAVVSEILERKLNA